MTTTWEQAPVWEEWREVTRLMWSGRIAFETELRRWSDPYLTGIEHVSVKADDEGGQYRTELSNHLATLENLSPFWALILLRSTALLEEHAKLVLYIVEKQAWTMFRQQPEEHVLLEASQYKLNGGIETWGTSILEDVGQDWKKVYGGKAGLVEVSQVRNALAHGIRFASPDYLASCRNRGCTVPFDEGDPISLDFRMLHTYRGRIRSLCRVLCDGVVHTGRTTG